jgi:hypothetical protein
VYAVDDTGQPLFRQVAASGLHELQARAPCRFRCQSSKVQPTAAKVLLSPMPGLLVDVAAQP